MAIEGMKKLEQLHIRKVRDRIGEIRERFWYSQRTPIADVAIAETMEHLTLAQAKRLSYTPAKDGRHWGKNWGTAWFRLRIGVPKSMKGDAVKLLFDLENSECLIYRDGMPVQGLCWSRKEYLLLDKARGGERIELYVEAGANARLGAFDIRTMHQPSIAVFHPEVWDAYWDLSALFDIIDPTQYCDWTGKPYHRPPEHDTRASRILFALNEAVDLFDYGDPTPEELRAQARRVRERLKPVYACRANASAQTFAAMGHAHIDVAWKWPLAESVRKCGRTFANVLEMMDRYPEFTFVQSQPQLYAYAKERYPELYRGIRKRIKEGRWIAEGCMWVESDCNIPSGESLVRQVLFGTRFFKKEFGCEVETLWLPDVFGYSGALPQILKRSGIDYFFTTKIALNQFTAFPYHSFFWEGIDGSRVLSHFMPAEEYSSQVEPWLIRTGENVYAEKDRSSIQILPYGHGDGGGGPAREQVERLFRYKDLEGMPKVKSMTPKALFEQLEAESAQFPTWVGELYLENHRGTYTTQCETKKNNRRAEVLLRDAELLSSLALAAGGRYRQKELNAAWKLVLLNQFHDIIPGSSIDEVYDEADGQYAEVFATGQRVLDEAWAHLAKRVDTRGKGKPVLVFNSLGWDRRGAVAVEPKGLLKGRSYVAVGSAGEASPVQICADGKARFVAGLPAVGHHVFHIQSGTCDAPLVQASDKGMENDCVRIRFDKQGRLRSVYDKRARREVLAPRETGNRYVLFEDKMATCGTSWDIDIYFKDKPLEHDGTLLSAEVVEQGPVRAVVRFTRKMSRSTISQDVILTAGSARVDFGTTVDWGDEKDVMLKVAFPVDIRAAKARYEIQHGSLERPTHNNLPADFAQFEVPAQRWADLSEGNYGVALLNDCKYGYDIKGNLMRLTLLRAPKDPGLHADVNKTHTFTYALLPHEGDFTGGVVQAGCELNTPALARQVAASAGALAPNAGWMALSAGNIVIDAVKKAEDDRSLIVRMYEAHGWRGCYAFETELSVKAVIETDLMEREEKKIAFRRGKAAIEFRPFEVKTLKLVL